MTTDGRFRRYRNGSSREGGDCSANRAATKRVRYFRLTARVLFSQLGVNKARVALP